MLVQFGSGPNKLPGWDNRDLETDIRKPLPFPIGSVDFILAEHVIEHVEFREGVFFLGECLRVLQPGGVLRLAFPDITREIPIEDYRACIAPHYHRQINCPEDVWLSILLDWGHRSCWSKEMALRVLMAVGFESATPRLYGSSPYHQLCGVEGHHLSMGMGLAIAETTVIEAVR